MKKTKTVKTDENSGFVVVFRLPLPHDFLHSCSPGLWDARGDFGNEAASGGGGRVRAFLEGAIGWGLSKPLF